MSGMKAVCFQEKPLRKETGRGGRKRRKEENSVETWLLLEKEPAEAVQRQVHSTEGWQRLEGILGTDEFLWWQPWLGRQGTKAALRVLWTKSWCL